MEGTRRRRGPSSSSTHPQVTCASWLPIPTPTTTAADNVMFIVLGKGKTKADGITGNLQLASYSFKCDDFVSKGGEEEEEGGGECDGLVGIAVHPGGDGVVVSFSKCCKGSIEGDICIVEVQKMQVRHLIKRAHVGAMVTSIEFSSNGRALLSVSNEWAARINPIHCEADWKDLEIYLVLLTMVLISGILFYIFFEYSDTFWNFPLGREQPARPPIEAILGDHISSDDQNIW